MMNVVLSYYRTLDNPPKKERIAELSASAYSFFISLCVNNFFETSPVLTGVDTENDTVMIEFSKRDFMSSTLDFDFKFKVVAYIGLHKKEKYVLYDYVSSENDEYESVYEFDNINDLMEHMAPILKFHRIENEVSGDGSEEDEEELFDESEIFEEIGEDVQLHRETFGSEGDFIKKMIGSVKKSIEDKSLLKRVNPIFTGALKTLLSVLYQTANVENIDDAWIDEGENRVYIALKSDVYKKRLLLFIDISEPSTLFFEDVNSLTRHRPLGKIFTASNRFEIGFWLQNFIYGLTDFSY